MYDDGDGPPKASGEQAARERAAEVRVAFEGLLGIRRLTNTGMSDPESVPALWERGRMVRAVALALEASGVAPSAVDASGTRCATGYRVRAAPEDERGSVLVDWIGPPGAGAGDEEEAALTRCAGELERLGWDALVYRGRGGHRFLEVRPPWDGRTTG
jgi:hypothetical protein